MLGYNNGLNLSNIDETAQSELDEHVFTRWSSRGPLYNLYATSLMADYAPDFLKLHWWGAETTSILPSGGIDSEVNTLPNSVQQVHSYMMLGWETGIRNQFRILIRKGFTKSQFMEVVMFGRLAAGMRGLGHVYHAIGDMLPDTVDGDGKTEWPAGWEPDAAAFKSGLDLTTRTLTAQDRANLTAWYEKTIGYLPKSVLFGMKYDSPFLKVHRAMWEHAIKTLPKQNAPYLMLRHAVISNDRDAIREAALLGRSWGLSNDWIIRGITHTAGFFTDLRGLYAAYDAVDDILQ
jgi:hypothetical protein